jgi:hypothetical protein
MISLTQPALSPSPASSCSIRAALSTRPSALGAGTARLTRAPRISTSLPAPASSAVGFAIVPPALTLAVRAPAVACAGRTACEGALADAGAAAARRPTSPAGRAAAALRFTLPVGVRFWSSDVLVAAASSVESTFASSDSVVLVSAFSAGAVVSELGEQPLAPDRQAPATTNERGKDFVMEFSPKCERTMHRRAIGPRSKGASPSPQRACTRERRRHVHVDVTSVTPARSTMVAGTFDAAACREVPHCLAKRIYGRDSIASAPAIPHIPSAMHTLSTDRELAAGATSRRNLAGNLLHVLCKHYHESRLSSVECSTHSRSSNA